MSVKRMLCVGALGLVTPRSASGAWFAGAGSARGPESVRNVSSLGRYNGSTGAAVYATSCGPTIPVKWTNYYLRNTSLRAGMPCFTWAATAGNVTAKVLVGATPGSYIFACL